jgi:hypothetical protein
MQGDHCRPRWFAHSGRDMRALGSLGGKGRKAIDPERVHEGLRSYLKREVDPARVWEAIERALEGQNESARVSASKLLFDALYEPSAGTCPVCKEREANSGAGGSEADRPALPARGTPT